MCNNRQLVRSAASAAHKRARRLAKRVRKASGPPANVCRLRLFMSHSASVDCSRRSSSAEQTANCKRQTASTNHEQQQFHRTKSIWDFLLYRTFRLVRRRIPRSCLFLRAKQQRQQRKRGRASSSQSPMPRDCCSHSSSSSSNQTTADGNNNNSLCNFH